MLANIINHIKAGNICDKNINFCESARRQVVANGLIVIIFGSILNPKLSLSQHFQLYGIASYNCVYKAKRL